MASRIADAKALAKRCEKAGWRVENGSKGIKVYNDRNEMYTIHLTSSDVNGLGYTTRRLEREAGLLEAEAHMANLKVTTSQARTATARKAAATRAAKAAENGAQLAAVAKAAGPYLTEAEDVLIGWFAEKHPAPWMRWVNITPEIAQYLIDQHNQHNRPIIARQVQHYRNIILSGQWHLTHQGVAMDVDAVLQDGQHRLAAVVDAGEEVEGLKVPFAFFVGMPAENFKAIDEGLVRSAAHLFNRDHEKNSNVLQGCVRLVIAYQDQSPRQRYRLRMTNESVLTTFDENPEEFRAAANYSQANYKKVNSSASPFAAARYLLRRANEPGNQFVEAFFEGLITGRKAGTRLALDDDDPRAVYRETMQSIRTKGKKRIGGIDQMAMIILSWNNLINNYRPRHLRFADDAPIPRVMVCRDTGANASATPELLAGEIGYDEDEGNA